MKNASYPRTLLKFAGISIILMLFLWMNLQAQPNQKGKSLLEASKNGNIEALTSLLAWMPTAKIGKACPR